MSHWIVDLVDTGNTLRANDLVERETVLHCGAVLVANRASQKLKLDAYLGLMARLGSTRPGQTLSRRTPRNAGSRIRTAEDEFTRQQPTGIRRARGPAQQEALPQLHTELHQQVALLGGLDPLPDERELERATDGDDRFEDQPVGAVGARPGDESRSILRAPSGRWHRSISEE